MPRRHLGTMWIVAAVVAASLPQDVRAAALAATAGTLFEALPFVLGAASLPRGPFVRLFELLGCGCGGSLPGALALPALGIAWLAFGAPIACARVVAALLWWGVTRAAVRRRCTETDAGAGAVAPPTPAGTCRDPLAEIAGLAPTAFAGALLAEALHALPHEGFPGPLLAIIGGAGGLLVGLLMPCATGAVAIAAALRGVAPTATLAILATAGIVRIAAPWRRVSGQANPPCGARSGERAAFVLIAFACGFIALRGPSGFVNPRFVLPLGLAAIGAAAFGARLGARSRTAAPFPAAVPALLVAITLGGSPLPQRAVSATTLDDAYPGEALDFVGAVATGEPEAGAAPDAASAAEATTATRPATLVRYTITCCRVDAEPRAVRLDRALSAHAGTWFDARGTLALDSDGAFTLRVATLRAIPPPSDPFAYR